VVAAFQGEFLAGHSWSPGDLVSCCWSANTMAISINNTLVLRVEDPELGSPPATPVYALYESAFAVSEVTLMPTSEAAL